MHQSISDFCKFLEDSGRASSARTYGFSLSGFERWLVSKFSKNIDAFTQHDVIVYMSTLSSPRTANLFKAAIKGYSKFRAGNLPMGDPQAPLEMQRTAQIDLVRNRKINRAFEKVSLSAEEVNRILRAINRSRSSLYPLALVSAYFGNRPIEMEKNISEAKINWRDRSMIIKTAKTGNERFLCWDEKITPHIKVVAKRAPYPYAGEYLTKNIGALQKSRRGISIDIKVTAKTFRKTFQTQERLIGVEDMYIDHILGHVGVNPIADIYTDFTTFQDKIREIMTTDKHYMIRYDVI